MQLTKNFSLHELTKSEAALRHGMKNEPSAVEIQNLKLLAEKVLQPVRDQFGPVSINSGFRSAAVNKKVGGSTTSDHCRGMAADIEVPGVPNYDLALWISKNLKFRQVILEFYTAGIPDSGWVHVSYNPTELKGELLTASTVNKKTVYTAGLHK
jgi:zinc D-Ala-D-Ala carboxypeptidase